jgi:hypothetical protein
MWGSWGSFVGESGREIDGEIIEREDGPDLIVDLANLPDDIFDDDTPRWQDAGTFPCPNASDPQCDPDGSTICRVCGVRGR